ncbi:MAG: FecR domain-containing protein, partial [Candidatus Methylomirabilia bacterium]
MSRAIKRNLTIALLAFTLWPTSVLAQLSRAGVVTTIHGVATVARVAMPREIPLKFKDDLFVKDKISTRENSIVRVLLGGKALVTIRELSVVTISEEVGRATVNMKAGKIAIAVARQRMRPGEVLEIRTPNAIAAVRGTVVVVEVLRATAQGTPGPATVVTNLYVLRGHVLFNPLGRTPVTVGPGQSGRVSGNTLGQIRPNPPLAQIMQGLKSDPQHTETPEATKEHVRTKAQARAAAEIGAVGAQPGEVTQGGPEGFGINGVIIATTNNRLRTVEVATFSGDVIGSRTFSLTFSAASDTRAFEVITADVITSTWFVSVRDDPCCIAGDKWKATISHPQLTQPLSVTGDGTFSFSERVGVTSIGPNTFNVTVSYTTGNDLFPADMETKFDTTAGEITVIQK